MRQFGKSQRQIAAIADELKAGYTVLWAGREEGKVKSIVYTLKVMFSLDVKVEPSYSTLR